MPTITLRQPNGEQLVNPAPKLLREIVLERGSDYWQVGSGDLSIRFQEDARDSRLMLILEESLGIHVGHIAEPFDFDYHVSLRPSSSAGAVEVMVGGQSHRLPISTFIGRQSAWEAVRDFLRTGERTDKVQWARRSEIDWPDEEYEE